MPLSTTCTVSTGISLSRSHVSVSRSPQMSVDITLLPPLAWGVFSLRARLSICTYLCASLRDSLPGTWVCIPCNREVKSLAPEQRLILLHGTMTHLSLHITPTPTFFPSPAKSDQGQKSHLPSPPIPTNIKKKSAGIAIKKACQFKHNQPFQPFQPIQPERSSSHARRTTLHKHHPRNDKHSTSGQESRGRGGRHRGP